jgi:heme A synthase
MAPDTKQTPSYVAPTLCYGFLAAIVMWCAWFLTHIPGAQAPAPVVAGLLLALMAVSLSRIGRVGLPKPWLAGLLAGLVAALINMLLLGSRLVEQPETTADIAPGTAGLRPDALFMAIGFIALCIVVGIVAATLGARFANTDQSESLNPDDNPATPATPDWLALFAKITVLATVPVLLIGGIVTSADAGLAVPDWPGSYGANMFLYPFALMADPRIFLEHAHRLFGSLIGLTTLVLCLLTLFSGQSKAIKGWAVGLLVLVIVQGVMGGMGRVLQQDPYFGALHGITAQVFFALVVAFAAVLAMKKPDADAPPFGKAGPATAIWLALVLLQLVFGALYRHLSASDDEIAGVGHILMSHIGLSFIVLVMAIVTGSMLRGRKGENASIPQVRIRVGKAMNHVVGMQFILGWAAFFVTRNRGTPPTPDELATPQAPLVETLVTMAHQLNGAFVLAIATLAVVLWIRSWCHALPPRPAEAHDRANA